MHGLEVVLFGLPENQREMCTPLGFETAVRSIQGTITGVALYPVVNSMVPGEWIILFSCGTPFSHDQESRYQKLFWKLIAPPVVKSSSSQCWARIFNLVIICSTLCNGKVINII